MTLNDINQTVNCISICQKKLLWKYISSIDLSKYKYNNTKVVKSIKVEI